jgi:hypothetical protein
MLLWSAFMAAPIAAQDPTPRPDPTLQAGATGDFPQGSPAYGPLRGDLIHEPEDTLVVSTYSDLAIANFVVEVTFINPYDGANDGWSHGIFFRDQGDSQFRLIFDSLGNWELSYVDGEEFTTVQSGVLTNVETQKSGRNLLRLAANGAGGLFSLNGEIIAALDLSQLTLSGDVAVGTGLYFETEVRGAVTEYEDFTIWSIGILPTLTPTATAAAATFRAIVGSNRGEIAIGGGETWNFEGVEGERLSIRVIAERPAGRETTTEERLEQNLFDTYLIVRDPGGEIIAENDDNEDLSEDDLNITNSLVSLTLPRSGLYQFEVRSYADESGGAYTLEITRLRQLVPQGAATPTPTSAQGEGRG